MGEPPPDLRASDADRERAADRLRGAAGDGQLTMDELDERLQATYGARTRHELERLTADVNDPDADVVAQTAATGVTVRPGDGGARWLVAIMSGLERKGRWRLGARCTSLNIMGGSDLDLSDVELAAEHVHLTVYSIMGGADIYVPEGVALELSEFAFMGGNTVEVAASHSSGRGPVVHLRLISVMGGSTVRPGPKRSRRALERQR